MHTVRRTYRELQPRGLVSVSERGKTIVTDGRGAWSLSLREFAAVVNRRRDGILAFLLGGLAASAGSVSAAAQSAGPAVADTNFASSISLGRALLNEHMGYARVPGMQVAVWKDGRLVWSEGLGWADVENLSPVTPTTRFPIGSVSKALTAVAAARLVDRGVLKLDTDVRQYVPTVPRRHGRITPRMLGQHLSGIRHYRSGEEPGSRHFNSVTESLGVFLEDSLLFPPGTQYGYSSYGFNLLSAAMEAAAQKDFLTVLRDEVVRPLQLSGTMANEVDRLIPFRTRGYDWKDGRRVLADVEDPSYKWAGGGLLSTAEDLVRVGAALIEPGYLSANSLSLLFTQPPLTNGERPPYGFGWELYNTKDGRQVRFHGGNLSYARAHLMILPADRLVVAHLANTGTSIFFNNPEMQWLAELFRGQLDSTATAAAATWAGTYTFRSVESDIVRGSDGRFQAVPGDTVAGQLTIVRQRGVMHGVLTIGTGSMRVPAIMEHDGGLELIGIAGNWRKVRLSRVDGGYRGSWEQPGPPGGRLDASGAFLDIRRVTP